MTGAVIPITHRERELGAIINAYNEVTERLKSSHDRLLGEARRLREQLEEKNIELARRERLAALGEMAAGVAHEIRNPLAAIKLYASLLLSDGVDEAETHRVATRISEGVCTLDSIVGDVLAFAGQNDPQMVQVNLGEVVEECLALAAPAVSARRTTVRVGEGLRLIGLRGDPGQLLRALLNLVLNAVDAAGDEGEVSVQAGAGSSDEQCAIRVTDNGPGIPPGETDRVFNPFFTTKHQGTGLGLAIVHRIAEAHGGSVRAANPPSGGAELTMIVPRWTGPTTDSQGSPGRLPARVQRV